MTVRPVGLCDEYLTQIRDEGGGGGILMKLLYPAVICKEVEWSR